MPRGDGTGPMGMGPMTGRAAGFCAGNSMPGYTNQSFGRGGFGLGFSGCGRGRRNQFYTTGLPGWKRFGGYSGSQVTITPEQEKMALKNQADALQRELESIRKRQSELETVDADDRK